MPYLNAEREHLIEAVNETGKMYKALSLELDKAKAEIGRLREALRVIADGDVPRQHAVIWRRDGELSKHDKCPHYQVMYEGCEECVSSFARAALKGASDE